jgi:exodeoxyribonuclease-3
MRIISWNVNGIRAIVKKGFLDFIRSENPDIICIQEARASPDQIDIGMDDYPYKYWNPARKKGYSGTAIFSKLEPLSMARKTGFLDDEGRVLVIEFELFYLVNVYVPNSGRGLPRLSIRKKWDKNFLMFIKSLERKKPVVLCGDFNVAHKDIDLANPKLNYNKTAGYMQYEIDGIQKYFDNGFVDAFREFDRSPGRYTYWQPWRNMRLKNIGWRIDYFLVSRNFIKKVKSSFILNKVMGSDHCPVGLEIK